MIRKIRNREKGVSLTEYGIIISLLSATLWAVFATWEIWGWGEDINTARTRGEGRATLAADLGVDELYEESDEASEVTVTTTVEAPTTTVATTTVAPEVTNDDGELTLTGDGDATGNLNVRYMGAHDAGLAPYSSLWMRVVGADGTINDVQLTTDNEGDARDVVSDYELRTGDQVSFFLRVKPKNWSTDYYNWCSARGYLTGWGSSAYYDLFSTDNTQTTVTGYEAGAAGNYWGTDEFHVVFEDLYQNYYGCDDDFNDAEFRVAVDWDESDLLI